MTKNTTQDEYRRNLPRSWGETFGDTAPDPLLFTDQPQEPREGSSAYRIGRAVKLRERAAVRGRDMAQLRAAAAEDVQEQALERAIGKIRRGKPVDDETRILALAALRARGDMRLSSAEIHAARALSQPAQDNRPPKRGTRAAAQAREDAR